MDIFKNPQVYKTDSVEINGIPYTGKYFRDDRGRDWYETLTAWAGAVAFDESDIVCAFESDVSMMGMIEGRSIHEVRPEDVPDDVLGNYKFCDDKFVDIRPSKEKQFQQKKDELLAAAAWKMAPLQDAVDLGNAQNVELSQLTVWKRYRVQLNRLKLGQDWPVIPDDYI